MNLDCSSQKEIAKISMALQSASILRRLSFCGSDRLLRTFRAQAQCIAVSPYYCMTETRLLRAVTVEPVGPTTTEIRN